MEKTERMLRITYPMQARSEVRQENGEEVREMIVEGYAFKYNAETVLFRTSEGFEYREVIERGALEGADLTDVPMKYNHNDAVFIVARTRNLSLELRDDGVGLFIHARFIDTQTGRDLFKMIQERLIDKMSFAFTEEEWSDDYNEEFTLHRIRKFRRIWDVSAVDIPAYDQTEIYARSISQLERGLKQHLERGRRDEYKRSRMLLKSKITLLEDENE